MSSASSTNRFARYASTLRPISSQPFAITLPKLPCGPPLTSSNFKGLPYFAKRCPSRLQFHIISRRSISFPQENVIVPCHLEFHRHYHFTISVPTISLAKAGIFLRKSPQRCSECPPWWNEYLRENSGSVHMSSWSFNQMTAVVSQQIAR